MVILKAIGIVVGGTSILFGIGAAIAALVEFIENFQQFQRSSSYESVVTLTFDTFKRIKDINPQAYKKSSYELYRINKYGNREVKICFKTIFDYIKYLKDTKADDEREKYNEKHQREIDGLEKLRNLTQQDIDALYKEIDKENEKAKKEINRVATNLSIDSQHSKIIVDDKVSYIFCDSNGKLHWKTNGLRDENNEKYYSFK